ncbi:Molybdenum cofactor guanylyltransferase [Arsenophonus endosymbiont of Aleurodicus floccissimus]|uniref:molybdenum cofactor guanylyltransferase n=1 Tax=Arsenophonus endosymbiont of Aleurodicus floccissimus TaxID=2152761 RepID=UPI000ED3DBE7|nr:molybdenum cofactor guanylyltransferase [Arsenophonus endosymbiont of Aleurodicus floccissimus]SPP31781.1 Molybdenum cofactor guanylyltransferase [Arsenophonus endosymbiont of Aleurodicus floccissimus]
MSIAKIVVTGIILAGGQARRMNRCDKGLIQITGKSLYQYAIAKLLPQVDYLFINANRNITKYQQAGYPVIVDTIVDFAGPLACMLAGIYAAQTSWVAFVPCDVPDFPDDLVMKLCQGRKENVGSYVASTGFNPSNFCITSSFCYPNTRRKFN